MKAVRPPKESMWVLLWMNKLPECSSMNSTLQLTSPFTCSHPPHCYLNPASLPVLFTLFLPVSSKAFTHHLFAQVSLGGKFPQLCFFLSQATVPPLSCFLTNSSPAKDPTPALSAPSCHLASPKRTWKPCSSIMKSGLKTLLYPSTPIPSMWKQPMC